MTFLKMTLVRWIIVIAIGEQTLAFDIVVMGCLMATTDNTLLISMGKPFLPMCVHYLLLYLHDTLL
jgi:hypothetical protein